jgi:hypothetical protein
MSHKVLNGQINRHMTPEKIPASAAVRSVGVRVISIGDQRSISPLGFAATNALGVSGESLMTQLDGLDFATVEIAGKLSLNGEAESLVKAQRRLIELRDVESYHPLQLPV